MTRLEIQPFTEDFVAAAGELLAGRHRAHRAAEPLLPERFESPTAAAAEVESLLHAEAASGVVGLREGRPVGYLLGVRRPDQTWGPHVWIELAGHAVENAEDLRDLYGAAARRWVADERVRHYAMVPATDPELVGAWSRVGFGQQHAHGILEIPETDWPEGVRLATEDDVDALLELSPLLQDHQAQSPVFGGGPPPPPEDELRAELVEDVARTESGDLVAERDGQIIGAFEIVAADVSSVHSGLARPEGAALLGWAATRPDIRGSGAGVALTQGAFAWARERGHDVMVTDWRVTNLLASRFWPARGFRESFLRLYRHIP